jgi:hypothetical protein
VTDQFYLHSSLNVFITSRSLSLADLLEKLQLQEAKPFSRSADEVKDGLREHGCHCSSWYDRFRDYRSGIDSEIKTSKLDWIAGQRAIQSLVGEDHDPSPISGMLADLNQKIQLTGVPSFQGEFRDSSEVYSSCLFFCPSQEAHLDASNGPRSGP